MEIKKSRFGRFTWLFILVVVFVGIIMASLATPATGFIWIGVFLLGIYLHNKSLASDQENGISIRPFKNILLPWPKAAIGLAILALAELLIAIPLMAYTFAPCSMVDLIRKADGCLGRIPTDIVWAIAFSRDGKQFATFDPSNVRIWSYPDLKLLSNLRNYGAPGPVHIALSSNGQMLAICTFHNPIGILESKTGNVLYALGEKNQDKCEDITFTSDDKLVVALPFSIQTWDVINGKLLDSFSARSNQRYLKLTNDGGLAAAISVPPSGIEIWRVSDHHLVTILQSPDSQTKNYSSAIFSAEAKYLYAIRSYSDFRAEIQKDYSIVDIWNLETKKIDQSITQNDAQITKYMPSSSNNNAAALGNQSCQTTHGILYETPCVYLVQQATKHPQLIGLPSTLEPFSLAFSPTDNKLLIGTNNNLYIWQVP